MNLLIGTGHFLSHFYILSLAPLFIFWREEFDVSFTVLGLAATLMAGTTAILQTPAGFLVDRHGAKFYLIGGTALMALAMAAMAAATSFWQILVLATLSGVGNAVFHPADYAILSGSIPKEKLGRAFAFHLFTGHLGFALAPLTVTFLALTMGWRFAVLAVGLLGVFVVIAIALQSSILSDQAGGRTRKQPVRGGTRSAIFSRPMLLFFAFFMFGAMAQAGIQHWLIIVLQVVNGVSIELASWGLSSFVGGTLTGVLLGGWLADSSAARHFLFASVLITTAAVLIFAIGILSLPIFLIFALIALAGAAFGASRVSRDIIVKNATPPGQIGSIFGFVSAGLPLGQAITPVPFGYLIDQGHADYVLIVVAGILMLSLLCGGSGNMARATPAEE